MSHVELNEALDIISKLDKFGVNPILYGSLGASLYLGAFKKFNDIDLLVPVEWLNEKWPKLQAIMADLGFSLVDEHEHEFQNSAGKSVAFAEETVLTRDGIISSLKEVANRNVNGVTFRALRPEALLSAYNYSVKDGYRIEHRGKKDAEVIALLRRYNDGHKRKI